MKNFKTALTAAVCLIILLAGCLAHDHALMNRLADKARALDMHTGECFLNDMPLFGDAACVDRDDSDKRTVIHYTVSNSRYSKRRSDYNKSRILGAYVGEKSIEFMKGFVGGRNVVSKHAD